MNSSKNNIQFDRKTFEEIDDFHRQILTLDSHIDLSKDFRDTMFESKQESQVDFPKMKNGNLAAACFVAYVPQGKCQQNAYKEAFNKAIELLKNINSQKGTSHGINVRVCSHVSDIKTSFDKGCITVIPVIENGYVMGEDIENLKYFKGLGARYMTLTHNGHNALADSAVPRPALGDEKEKHGGLSQLGREAIEEMNNLGIVVDVSHGSRKTMLQATDFSKVPVIASHSCVKALCDHRRNLDDEQLKLLASKGGVIQITAMADFLRRGGDQPNNRVTISDFVDHLDYVVRLVGPQYVGISSDFEGGGGIDGWDRVDQSVNITRELLRRGYNESEIRAFWSGNLLRVFQKAEDYARISS